MEKFPSIKISWIILTISGLIILIGIPEFWSGNFNYWLVAHLIYGAGALLFLFDK